jgi:hypothetical protein
MDEIEVKNRHGYAKQTPLSTRISPLFRRRDPTLSE